MRNLQQIGLHRHITKRSGLDYPALIREKVGIGISVEQCVRGFKAKAHPFTGHGNNRANVVVSFGQLCARVGEQRLGFSIELGDFADGQFDTQPLLTGYANLIAHIPISQRAQFHLVCAEICRQGDGNRKDDFLLITKVHQVRLIKRQPVRGRPLKLANLGAFRSLPFRQGSRLPAVTPHFPVGVPVLSRVEPERQPGGFTRHNVGGLGQ